MNRDIEAYLHEHIPLTRHLGIQVVSRDERAVVLSAPLEPNINHRSTAFGGSIASVGILASWTLLNFRLRDEGLQSRLVIQHSTVDYLEPVASAFEAVSFAPDEAAWERFTRMLKRRRKARIILASELRAGEKLVAKHTGAFVALYP